MTNRRLWVPNEVPNKVELREVDAFDVTHVSNHPLVGYDEIEWATYGGTDAIGYDMEGVLVPFGVEEIETPVMDWLENQKAAVNIGRFVITNCRDYDKVEGWTYQLSQVGVTLYSAHILSFNTSLRSGSEIVVDKARRKPNRFMYDAALERLGVHPDHAAFVGDKISDAAGAMAAGYSMRVLCPRLGQGDHTGDRYWTRPKQWGFMVNHDLTFDLDSGTEIERQI